MDIHSIGRQKYYLVTGGCALFSLFSSIFLPFVEVSNESTLSSHPLIFTGIELTGSNWLNLLLPIGMLVIVAKFTFRLPLFEFKETPLATQEYWAQRTVIVIALLGMLVNIWTFFNIKQIFDAYSQTDNLYSVKPMPGCWLILICMTAIVVNNVLKRIPAPAKDLAQPANPADHPSWRQMAANYLMSRSPAAGNQAGSQVSSSQPMPVPTDQSLAQQRPVNPPAPMPMQPVPQQPPVNPAAPQQLPAKPAPMQPRPFSLPALPQTPPIQPAVQQKPVTPLSPVPQTADVSALPQPASPSIAPQRPFSLPVLPSAQPAAQQEAPNTPVFPMPVGQAIKQPRPFSLPGLPQTPPMQQAVQQKSTNAPAVPSLLRPAGQSIVLPRPFSLPALPGAAPHAQTPDPSEAQQNKPKEAKSQFMKPPSQA